MAAAGLSADSRVELVYLEVTFADMYQGQPPFDLLYRFLRDRGLGLVALYNYVAWPGRSRWCDALFARL